MCLDLIFDNRILINIAIWPFVYVPGLIGRKDSLLHLHYSFYVNESFEDFY